MKLLHRCVLAVTILLSATQPLHLAQAEKLFPIVYPEQRRIIVRDPSELPRVPVPRLPAPPTVTRPLDDPPEQPMSLDEAIRIALDNADVVRVLTGLSATSSGVTIYDPAISNTVIDEQNALFDPMVSVGNQFERVDTPFAGDHRDQYNLDLAVDKTTATGGTASLRLDTNARRFRRDPLRNRLNRSSFELGYTQPLLQGGGIAVNRVPIVLARIDTERSYFRLKDSVQELVRGVVAAYWALVFSRTDVWARRQQVQQGQGAYDRVLARKAVGFDNLADLSQARLALAGFKANLVTAEGSVLNREAALRNILGIPPSDGRRIVPHTRPTRDRLEPNWDRIVELAAERRPDIIELKLIMEADQQSLLQARNGAQPQLNAVALYRWNGLEGELPAPVGHVSSSPGQFTDWTLAVNFSVPLGLRRERAAVRRQELVIARDRANIQQGVHNLAHELAAGVRDLSQSYEQYEAFRETRQAARINLEQQAAQYRSGRTIFLNVLAAITDWGNAVSAEAQALLQYNTDLATLERQTGTILETHGVRFYEERFLSIGPLGRLFKPRAYPQRLPPTENVDLYETGEEPSEEFFELETPRIRRLEPPPQLPGSPPPEALPTPPRQPVQPGAAPPLNSLRDAVDAR